MLTTDDARYYSERERAERCLAANAADPAARTAHLELAAHYRKRAAEARRSAELLIESTLFVKRAAPRKGAAIKPAMFPPNRNGGHPQ